MINRSPNNLEHTAAPDGNFWRSVWKRIESSNQRKEPFTQVHQTTPEAPRDYVVEGQSATQGRLS